MMSASLILRPATEADAAACLEIYRPSVEEAVISFEKDVPTVEDFAARIRKSLSKWQWLVAEREGVCAGYAYGTNFRERHAYRFSVEVSAYVGAAFHRQGIARRLYLQLFDELAAMGYCHAYAGITLPNAGSEALHRKVGFEPIGVFRRVGWKFGRWHDVGWYQRSLRKGPRDGPPPEAIR